MALKRRQRRQMLHAQPHVHDIVTLLRVDIGIHAVAYTAQRRGVGNDSLVVQEAGSQLEVVSRRPHRHCDRLGFVPRLQTYLQRLFRGQLVVPCFVPSLLHNRDAGAHFAADAGYHWSSPYRQEGRKEK